MLNGLLVAFDGGVRGSQPGNGHAEGRAADVVEADVVAKLYG
jgi:hypothetical protein